METIRIDGLPEIAFAHIYGEQVYNSVLPTLPRRIEVTFLYEGSLQIEQNGITAQAQKNSVICNLFETPLHIRASGYHEQHTVCFHVAFSHTDERQNNVLRLPLLTQLQEAGRLCRLIDEIIRTHTLHTGNALICAGLFLQLLGELDSLNRQGAKNNSYGNLRYINRAKDYIYKNLQRPIRQSEVAEQLGVSPEYLCAIFKKTEGVSLMYFINRIKLERIRSLVEKENMKLRDAAELYGFTDANYVSRLFKKIFHMNITDIKKSKL